MHTNERYRLVAAALGVAALLGGCSGGAGSSSVAPSTNAKALAKKSATARLTLRIPRAKIASASTRRQPRYVSTASLGLGIRAGLVGGDVNTEAWQLFDISPTSKLCATDASSGYYTCTISIQAPVSTAVMDEFQIDVTDRAPATTDTVPMGNILSGTDSTDAITPNALNALSFTLTGTIGQLSVGQPAYSVWAAPGQSANVAVSLTAADVDNGIIWGSPQAYANPIVFTDNLTASPFTYPPVWPSPGVPTPPSNAVLPPAVAGPVTASIGYTAPTTGIAPLNATTTVATVIPDYISLPTVPQATFALDPLVVSANGAPTGSLALSASATTDTTVTVTETGAATFTVVPASTTTSYTLSNTGQLAATNGTLTFTVHAVSAGAAPAITITDPLGTTATIAVTIGT